MQFPIIQRTKNTEQTIEFGKTLSLSLPTNSLLCFFSDLGGGKTTLIKGLASQITGISSREVSSPTFNYLNIYEGKSPFYHFDLYRIKKPEEFQFMGFEEYFHLPHFVVIEWAERITSLIPENAYIVKIIREGENERLISINLWKKNETA